MSSSIGIKSCLFNLQRSARSPLLHVSFNAYCQQHAQILFVGGGPSGSYAAACLAREGFHVVILEAAEFPRLVPFYFNTSFPAYMRKSLTNPPAEFRYHIGESLLPSVRHHLRFIGADDKVDSFGFFKKVRLVFMLF